jgi:hypothetical protein
MKAPEPVGQAGYSLVEMLVATAITVTVLGLACGLAVEAHTIWRTDAARIDLQQRARVAADVLTRALLDTGGGPHAGAGKGPLVRALPPIVPRRTGARRADSPTLFKRDAFTVIRSVAEAEQAELLLAAPPGTGIIEITPSPSCALPACGFAAGSIGLLFDGRGNYDIFTIVHVDGMALTIRHHGGGSSVTYAAGSPFLHVAEDAYYLDPSAHLLRTYDGDLTDSPLLDDVVGMEVEYYGDIHPPLWPRPPAGEANCLYSGDGTYESALMPVLPGAASVTLLSPETLTDGPWCGSGANQFDADLLRVRRVHVTLRLQAADPAVRAHDPGRFRQPGSARRSDLLVSDVDVALDISLRNLWPGW